MAEEMTFEEIVVQGEQIEPGRLIWRRYKRPAYGVVEIFLDINPHLREHLATSPYLPVGVPVVIPIIQSVLTGAPSSQPTRRIWGTEPAS